MCNASASTSMLTTACSTTFTRWNGNGCSPAAAKTEQDAGHDDSRYTNKHSGRHTSKGSPSRWAGSQEDQQAGTPWLAHTTAAVQAVHQQYRQYISPWCDSVAAVWWCTPNNSSIFHQPGGRAARPSSSASSPAACLAFAAESLLLSALRSGGAVGRAAGSHGARSVAQPQIWRVKRNTRIVTGRYDLWLWLLDMFWPLRLRSEALRDAELRDERLWACRQMAGVHANQTAGAEEAVRGGWGRLGLG